MPHWRVPGKRLIGGTCLVIPTSRHPTLWIQPSKASLNLAVIVSMANVVALQLQYGQYSFTLLGVQILGICVMQLTVQAHATQTRVVLAPACSDMQCLSRHRAKDTKGIDGPECLRPSSKLKGMLARRDQLQAHRTCSQTRTQCNINLVVK